MRSTDGDQDWMDPEGGKESVERLRKAGNGQGKMYIVPHAGHHGTSTSIHFRESYISPRLHVHSLLRQPQGDERSTREGA